MGCHGDLTSRQETKQALFPEKAAGQLEKNSITNSFPPSSTTEIPMFPVFTKFLECEKKKKSLKYDNF